MKIVISNSSGNPIYEQVSESIKSQIINGEIEEGVLLPSIRSLARELNISVITTKRAYEELEKEGFVETVPGKGSYVAAQNKELLKEKRIKVIEGKLIEAINESRLIHLSLDELEEMLKILYEQKDI